MKTHKYDEKYSHTIQYIYTVSDLICEFKKKENSPVANTYYQLIYLKTPQGQILRNDESVDSLGIIGSNENTPLEIVKIDALDPILLKKIIPDFDKVVFNLNPIPQPLKESVKKELSGKEEIKVDTRLLQLFTGIRNILQSQSVPAK